jgi:hypothetical protein
MNSPSPAAPVLPTHSAIKNRLFRYADAPADAHAEKTLLSDLLWFEGKTRKPGKHHKGSTETNYPAEGAEPQHRQQREGRVAEEQRRTDHEVP